MQPEDQVIEFAVKKKPPRRYNPALVRVAIGSPGGAAFHRAGATLRNMTKIAGIHWGRALLGGFLAELLVFAIVFPTRYLFGQQAFLVSILIASAAMPFLFALWVSRRINSGFVLHGALVGLVAAVIYLGLAWGQPQPILYKIAHGLKLMGGAAGGVVASRRRPAAAIAVQSE